ncbi:MAG: cell envelope biogenesis protein TolA [Chelatococcus sp.]|uniref:cell envelope biogenesis protein TolA n=1 Tax=Chelatococcus sp. TaxID=1953771 RepID=UPI0025B890B7|nr:cell envelope biogenesis protein TolA [Chelatococcus sp.]MBX3536751.1 cell envelope biogenesis protein TolA [Chelatococcus sp.]
MSVKSAILSFVKREPGLVASSTGHAAILVAGLVAFSAAAPFADQQESVAVELMSASEFGAMMRGDKSAKEIKPDPKPRADKVAEVAEEKPVPGEAARDVPAPPSRPQVLPDPNVAETPPPPQQAKVEPKPEPPKVEPPKPTPKPEPAKVEPPKPEPVKEAEPKPEPPKRPEPPKQAETKPEPPKPEPKKVEAPKPEPKKPEPQKPEPQKPEPKKQDLAKLIESSEPKAKPQPSKPAEQESSKFNPSDIQKLLQSKEKAQNAASTGREVSRTASAGTRTGAGTSNTNSPKLSMAQKDAIGRLLKEQIQRCFSAPPGVEANTLAVVRMELSPDGSLSAAPKVVSSSSDPAFRSFAESLRRAVLRCAPYHIPAQYAPFMEDWRILNIEADSQDFLG